MDKLTTKEWTIIHQVLKDAYEKARSEWNPPEKTKNLKQILDKVQVQKSEEALERLNDFSYLDERQEKNRASNDKLRQDSDEN